MLGRQAAPQVACAIAALLLVAGPTLLQAQPARADGSTPTDSAEVPGLTEPPWHAWRAQTLDEEGASLNTETAVGPDGDVWVAYDDEPNVVLGLMHRDETGWHHPPGGPSKGLPSDLAVSPGGNPWVIWTDPYCGTCISIYDDAAESWSRIRAPQDGSDARMTFGPEGRLHVAWFNVRFDQPNQIEYGVFDPATDAWSFETVAESALDWLDIAVGPDGRVHLAWTVDNFASSYAMRSLDGDWSVQTVNDCDRYHSLATDASGTVHWACKANRGVLYKTKPVGGSWSMEVAQDGSDLVPPRGSGAVGFDLDLTVDAERRPHLVYSTGFNPFNPDDPLRPELPVYAVKTQGEWKETAVDREGSQAGFETSLALDDSGRPHAAYIRNNVVDSLGCGERDLNCFHLRYAEPVVAQADWQAQRAGGVLGLGG